MVGWQGDANAGYQSYLPNSCNHLQGPSLLTTPSLHDSFPAMAEPPAHPLPLADEQTVLDQHPTPFLLFSEDPFIPCGTITRSEVPDNFSDHSSVLPPVAGDSLISHIRNSYLVNQIVGSNRPSWATRETLCGSESQRIDYVWGTQKLIRKDLQVRLPDVTTSSTLAPSPAPSSVPTLASASAPAPVSV